MSLALSDEGSQKINGLSRIIVAYHVDDFLFGVFHHFLARHIAVRRSRTCKEQAQIVVDFGGSTHCRPGILVGGLLFNADDGTQSRDLVNIRTLHVAQEIAGISRKRLDIAPLSLSKNRIKSQ